MYVYDEYDQSIVDAQSAEITALQAMLDDRGGPTR